MGFRRSVSKGVDILATVTTIIQGATLAVAAGRALVRAARSKRDEADQAPPFSQT